MLSGAYLGNDPLDVAAFEKWLGADVDYVRAFTGRANWDDYVYSVPWVGEQLSETERPLLWTIPMFANQGSLEAAAEGDYDHIYTEIAKSVLRTSEGQDTILVRFGEEFNGTWMPWAAAGREDVFIDAYHNMVDAFRTVSDTFQFEWNVNLGGSVMNPEDAYPGDDYVDIVSMDFYYSTSWGDPADPSQAWNHFVNRDWGLQWLEDFATAHGKPTAYSEWGIDSDSPEFVDSAFEWFRDHDVVYQSYWYSDAAFAGMLDEDRPGATAAFVAQMTRELTSSIDVDAPPPVSAKAQSWHIGTVNVDDVLVGDERNNYLNGGGGTDTATGGAGDDTYMVDRSDDVVIEAANGGIDTVETWSLNYTLGAHVENLTLLNTWGSTGIGNALANLITGSSGADIIDGAGGNDWLVGGNGADIFVFRPGSGNDVVADFKVDGDLHDTLRITYTEIQSFSDLQSMMVQLGTDTYILLPSGNSIVLKGVDKDQIDGSHLDFGKPIVAPVEDPSDVDAPPPVSAKAQSWHIGTVNVDDVLVGDERNNYLNGGGGTDTATGGAGDDTYMVDRSDDVVIEAANGGIDTVETWSLNYTLGAHVENLTLLNTWGSTGIGNALANLITGSSGADIIDGAGGNDWLVGGNGADIFVFRPGSGNDVVADFKVDGGHDVIKLSFAEFATFDDVRSAMSEIDGNTILSLSRDASIVLLGISNDQISADHLAFT